MVGGINGSLGVYKTYINIPVQKGPEDPKKLEVAIRNAVKQSVAYGSQGKEVEDKIVIAIMAKIHQLEAPITTCATTPKLRSGMTFQADVVSCSIDNNGSVSFTVKADPKLYPNGKTLVPVTTILSPAEIGVVPIKA